MLKWANQYLPHFRCTILIGNVMRLPTIILFDTGSPFTVILPKEYLKTRLKLHSKVPKNLKTCALASEKFYRNPVDQRVVYRFKSDESKLIDIDYDKTDFLIPTKMQNIDRIKAIPSIIGVDFITSNNLTFVFNPSKNLIYFKTD